MGYEPQFRMPKVEPLPAFVTVDEAGRESWTMQVDNRDQYGKQRRTAVEALAEALGATTTYTSVKNARGTGNDAFLVTVTGGRPQSWDKITSWISVAKMMTSICAQDWRAEVTASLPEGATANDFQKAWRKKHRDYYLETGLAKARRIAAARTEVEYAFA